jgi:CubicO group peptidase (beta-lactamase class C family)
MGYDKTSQLCVYVGEELVINVVMSPKFDKITADHKTIISGASQAVSAIIFARLVDQGLIDYPTPISKYWPKFA